MNILVLPDRVLSFQQYFTNGYNKSLWCKIYALQCKIRAQLQPKTNRNKWFWSNTNTNIKYFTRVVFNSHSTFTQPRQAKPSQAKPIEKHTPKKTMKRDAEFWWRQAGKTVVVSATEWQVDMAMDGTHFSPHLHIPCAINTSICPVVTQKSSTIIEVHAIYLMVPADCRRTGKLKNSHTIQYIKHHNTSGQTKRRMTKSLKKLLRKILQFLRKNCKAFSTWTIPQRVSMEWAECWVHICGTIERLRKVRKRAAVGHHSRLHAWDSYTHSDSHPLYSISLVCSSSDLTIKIVHCNVLSRRFLCVERGFGERRNISIYIFVYEYVCTCMSTTLPLLTSCTHFLSDFLLLRIFSYCAFVHCSVIFMMTFIQFHFYVFSWTNLMNKFTENKSRLQDQFANVHNGNEWPDILVHPEMKRNLLSDLGFQTETLS